MNKSWNKVRIEAKLVSLPDIYWRLKNILASHDYSMQDVAQLIVYDPGLTARLLRIVNSAYFGFASRIDTVNHAVSILGVQQIEDLVLTTSIADALGDYQCECLDINQFWRASVYRAIAARNLAAECNLMDSERMFVSGLLSGIGHLIMYQSIPVLAQQARRESAAQGVALHRMEREIIGFDHAQVAAILLANWKIPDSLVGVIEHHLEPDPGADYFFDAAILNLAVALGNGYTENRTLEDALRDAHRLALDTTGLDAARCEAVDRGVRAQLQDVVSMLFPRLERVAG